MTRILALSAFVAALVCVSCVDAAPPTAWKAASLKRHGGPITATLSYERRQVGGAEPEYRRLELVVLNNGRTLFSGPLCNAAICGLDEDYSLKLQNVSGAMPDEVVIGSYTGGAHCCFLSYVVLVDGPHAGRMLVHNWGDPGFRGEFHDGTFDFVSADDRFAYAFTSFAGSGLPVQVWSIDAAGRFANVTSTRLDLVRLDARAYWKGYVQDRGRQNEDADVRGLVAAWCADEYRLGLKAACDSQLATAVKNGYLDGPTGWPRNGKFVTALKKSLATWGYEN